MVYYRWGQDGGPCRNFFVSCLWAYPAIPSPPWAARQATPCPSSLRKVMSSSSFPKAILLSQTPVSTQYNTASLDVAMLFPSSDWPGSYLLWRCRSARHRLSTCSSGKGTDEFSRAQVTRGGACLPDKNKAIMYFGSRNIVRNQPLCLAALLYTYTCLCIHISNILWETFSKCWQ